MIDILRPIVELAIIFPGALLAYLPMKQYLRISYGKLAAIASPILLLLCVIGGALSYLLQTGTLWVSLPILLILGAAYCRTVSITLWKSTSVILTVCGVFSCLRSISTSVNTILHADNTEPWFCLSAGLIYNLLCWTFVILAWYPATHAARDLLENEIIAKTWYVFWILPTVFIALNLFLTPVNPELLNQGRTLQLYLVNNIALLCLLLLFYLLFYLMASSLDRNDRLRQENQFLSMQQAQFNNLKTAIAETRQARHDMRHHFNTLSALANRSEWQELKAYLSKAKESIPTMELNLCDNPAVDGVACHYCLRYKENAIPFSIKLDLPHELPISEINMCLVLSNLLENALEASLRTNLSRRYIKVQAFLHSSNVILLTVENAFDGIVKEKNGVFQSTKHRGDGIGIQSVRRIAEKSGGYCSFTQSDGIFCANVMLRGESKGSTSRQEQA